MRGERRARAVLGRRSGRSAAEDRRRARSGRRRVGRCGSSTNSCWLGGAKWEWAKHETCVGRRHWRASESRGGVLLGAGCRRPRRSRSHELARAGGVARRVRARARLVRPEEKRRRAVALEAMRLPAAGLASKGLAGVRGALRAERRRPACSLRGVGEAGGLAGRARCAAAPARRQKANPSHVQRAHAAQRQRKRRQARARLGRHARRAAEKRLGGARLDPCDAPADDRSTSVAAAGQLSAACCWCCCCMRSS